MLLHLDLVPHGHRRKSTPRLGAIFAEKEVIPCCQPAGFVSAAPATQAQSTVTNASTLTPEPFRNMKNLNDIQLLRINYLRGPNVWTYRSVLEVWLDLGALEDYPSNKIPGLTPG